MRVRKTPLRVQRVESVKQKLIISFEAVLVSAIIECDITGKIVSLSARSEQGQKSNGGKKIRNNHVACRVPTNFVIYHSAFISCDHPYCFQSTEPNLQVCKIYTPTLYHKLSTVQAKTFFDRRPVLLLYSYAIPRSSLISIWNITT
jgi:hypothetical protein